MENSPIQTSEMPENLPIQTTEMPENLPIQTPEMPEKKTRKRRHRKKGSACTNFSKSRKLCKEPCKYMYRKLKDANTGMERVIGYCKTKYLHEKKIQGKNGKKTHKKKLDKIAKSIEELETAAKVAKKANEDFVKKVPEVLGETYNTPKTMGETVGETVASAIDTVTTTVNNTILKPAEKTEEGKKIETYGPAQNKVTIVEQKQEQVKPVANGGK